jgi:two-component system sensor histidine kinase UhpB
VKHAQASLVTIRLLRQGRYLQLSVADDGHGLPPTPSNSGHGLANMRRRASTLGGDVAYEPTQGGGLRVVVQLPMTL